MLHWCTANSFHIANVAVGASSESSWTFRNKDLRKQLDYIVLDGSLQAKLGSCHVMEDFSTGSDHRAVTAWLYFSRRAAVKRNAKKRRSWNQSTDISRYKELLSANCAGLPLELPVVADKLSYLEKQMLQACHASTSKASAEKGRHDRLHPLEVRIQNLILERRSCTTENVDGKKAVCKEIRKLIREKLKLQKEERVGKILRDFRGLRDISTVLTPKKRIGISCVVDDAGQDQHSKAGISEVFATFYEQLYRSNLEPLPTDRSVNAHCAKAEAFTKKDLQTALRKMKSGKAKDSSGIVAEMVKYGGDILHDAILCLFNDILREDAVPPDTWQHTRLTVIFKKGDPKMASNYRPIAIIPILYKLFSRMLCNRIQSKVFSKLSPDQAAYRPGYATEDHLLSLTLLLERCTEWRQELWLGLVDFEKAFDCVEHQALFAVLHKFGVHTCYINLIQRLYENQTASVPAGVESRSFCISRGVKQGDPISGLLFIAVMEICFDTLKEKWCTLNKRRSGQYFGIVIDDDQDPLSSLRFADDVLLMDQNRSDVCKMLSHLRVEAAKYGLAMHLGKTKILTSAACLSETTATICGSSVAILSPHESEKYLGRKLCLADYHWTELNNRIHVAWFAFSKFQEIFKSLTYPFHSKARLFEAVVTPALLYGAASWTLTKEMETELVRTWRNMVRTMVGAKRLPDETWIEYIKRTTELAEEKMERLGYVNWTTSYRKKKFRFAGRAAQAQDNRWSKRLLDWKPHFRCFPSRCVGHPLKRWEDLFIELAGGAWSDAASDPNFWPLLEGAYVQQ